MDQRHLEDSVQQVAQRLLHHQGPKRWGGTKDPVALLVETILSHNTNDRNRDLAYRALKQAYADWDAVLDAPQDELAQVIRPAGLNHQKAKRIQIALRTLLAEQGAYTLDHLSPMTVTQARNWLMQLPGVGKKTAGIVLTFGLHKPYFAVDTHINRMTRRLGWVTGTQDAHEVMNAVVPPNLMGQFHLQLIAHGRNICKARKPLCADCVLQDLCPSAAIR